MQEKGETVWPKLLLSILNTQRYTRPDETDLVVQELLEENNADTYTDDSDDGLEDWRREEMDDDEELRTLMEFVFGSESD